MNKHDCHPRIGTGLSLIEDRVFTKAIQPRLQSTCCYSSFSTISCRWIHWIWWQKKLQSKGSDPKISSVEIQYANHDRPTMHPTVIVIIFKWTLLYAPLLCRICWIHSSFSKIDYYGNVARTALGLKFIFLNKFG